MPYVELVTVGALLQFIAFAMAVGRARSSFGVQAPATSGNEQFERYFRVQANTLEQLVVMLPAMWLFALRVDPHWAAGLGFVYLVGRTLYFRSYTRDPKSRGLGFALTVWPTLVMLLVAAIQILIQLLRD